MTKFFLSGMARVLVAAILCVSAFSCITPNYSLGEDLIPIDQQFDTYYAELPLEQIEMRMLDSLSGYSNTRITIGAVRDPEFGLTTRGCAITLVPMYDTLDFGRNPEFVRFSFAAEKDTLSCADWGQAGILQNVNVYELEEAPSMDNYDLNGSIRHSSKRVTKGVPVYAGGDHLMFNFSREFGEKYLTIKQEDLKDMEAYQKRFPGIFITTDAPVGEGGRINMFKLQLQYQATYKTIVDDYAQLFFTSEYDGVRKDTSFCFYYSPLKMFKVDSLLNAAKAGTRFPQYAYNVASHDTRPRAGLATDKIVIEGGGGLKPVLSASYLKSLLKEEVCKHTDDPGSVVINGATLSFPFVFPDDWTRMEYYPEYLNPSIRVRSDDGYVTFGSLTDATSETENPGDLNRSLCKYSPDVTYHIQQILSLDDDAGMSNYDIWMLIMKNETIVATTTGENEQLQEYMNFLNYSNYMNMMYGGGYGYGGYGYGGYGYPYGYGYGGYGGYGYDPYSYGYGYNNYYNYAMLNALANSTSDTSTTAIDIDKDRFYCGVLNGPQSSGSRPTIKLVYSVLKEN